MRTSLYSLTGYCRIIVSLILITSIACDNTNAQPPFEKSDDKTLSPYFIVLGDNSETDQLPLKSTTANVEIAGVIANVKVAQVYKNQGKSALEAIYVFPASTRAAVYDMKMTIGERTIQAVIKEREQARQDYERAKQEGKSASLLEQERPNVFQMNVANIMPGDEIKVELFYTEMLVPEKGVYEFVYPTVVGPRYSNKPEATAPPSDKWVANPYTTEGKKPLYTFDIKVNLNTGLPVKDVSCSTHETVLNYKSASQAEVSLKPGNESEGNRDFILRYRLQGDQIQSGVLLYQGKNENFFLAMVQPPKRVSPSMIPPREYVFIMDVSGSMNGFPIEISKKLMRNLLKNLRPVDKFNVVLFAGVSNVLSETSLPVTENNIQKAVNLIDQQEGSGGTEIVTALQKALALKGAEGYARSFVIATDGYVDVEKETFDLIRKNLGNANFFSFGIGSSVNRYIIEGMARIGNGEPFIIENPSKAEVIADQFREYIQTPVLTNVKVTCPGFTAYDVEPLTVPSMYADRPLLIYGKYKGTPSGKIVINGQTGEGNFSKSFDISTIKPLQENNALTYLWARNRIMLLDDYGKVPGNGEEIKKEMINLGLKYNLLTAYTSFIAIDSEVRNNSGQNTTIKQPLPLPEGVNNNAVSNASQGYASSRKMKSMAPAYSYDEEVLHSAPAQLVVEESKEEIIESEEPVFIMVEESATFQGGDIRNFLEWVQKNLQYPKELAEVCITGKVYAQFTVDETGKVTDIKILRGVDPSLDNEVIRVLQLSPSWKPGKQGGRAVKQQFTIPVVFKLSE